MKLIHLPTGETKEYGHFAAEMTLADYPTEYIRAELPQYWQVEGYDKSWEWAELEDPTERMAWVYFNWAGILNKGCCEMDSGVYKTTQPISIAEFEHHIYNPWKAREEMKQLEKAMKDVVANRPVNGGIVAQQLPEKGHIQVNEGKATPMAQDPTDSIVKPVSEFNDPNEQLDMSDIDKIREAAEKMGYELVRKDEISWIVDGITFVLSNDGLVIKADYGNTWLGGDLLETLIEKYNQFKSNS
jgi:hypothetical protein